MSPQMILRPRARAWRTFSCCLALAGVSAVSMVGCLNRPIEPIEPRTTSTIVEPLKQTSVDKIDILLMIDNSSSMTDKQAILKDAVPLLVKSLVNPACLDENGKVVGTPAGPLDS